MLGSSSNKRHIADEPASAGSSFIGCKDELAEPEVDVNLGSVFSERNGGAA